MSSKLPKRFQVIRELPQKGSSRFAKRLKRCREDLRPCMASRRGATRFPLQREVQKRFQVIREIEVRELGDVTWRLQKIPGKPRTNSGKPRTQHGKRRSLFGKLSEMLWSLRVEQRARGAQPGWRFMEGNQESPRQTSWRIERSAWVALQASRPIEPAAGVAYHSASFMEPEAWRTHQESQCTCQTELEVCRAECKSCRIDLRTHQAERR